MKFRYGVTSKQLHPCKNCDPTVYLTVYSPRTNLTPGPTNVKYIPFRRDLSDDESPREDKINISEFEIPEIIVQGNFRFDSRAKAVLMSDYKFQKDSLLKDFSKELHHSNKSLFIAQQEINFLTYPLDLSVCNDMTQVCSFETSLVSSTMPSSLKITNLSLIQDIHLTEHSFKRNYKFTKKHDMHNLITSQFPSVSSICGEFLKPPSIFSKNIKSSYLSIPSILDSILSGCPTLSKQNDFSFSHSQAIFVRSQSHFPLQPSFQKKVIEHQKAYNSMDSPLFEPTVRSLLTQFLIPSTRAHSPKHDIKSAQLVQSDNSTTDQKVNESEVIESSKTQTKSPEHSRQRNIPLSFMNFQRLSPSTQSAEISFSKPQTNMNRQSESEKRLLQSSDLELLSQMRNQSSYSTTKVKTPSLQTVSASNISASEQQTKASKFDSPFETDSVHHLNNISLSNESASILIKENDKEVIVLDSQSPLPDCVPSEPKPHTLELSSSPSSQRNIITMPSKPSSPISLADENHQDGVSPHISVIATPSHETTANSSFETQISSNSSFDHQTPTSLHSLSSEKNIPYPQMNRPISHLSSSDLLLLSSTKTQRRMHSELKENNIQTTNRASPSFSSSSDHFSPVTPSHQCDIQNSERSQHDKITTPIRNRQSAITKWPSLSLPPMSMSDKLQMFIRFRSNELLNRETEQSTPQLPKPSSKHADNSEENEENTIDQSAFLETKEKKHSKKSLETYKNELLKRTTNLESAKQRKVEENENETSSVEQNSEKMMKSLLDEVSSTLIRINSILDTLYFRGTPSSSSNSTSSSSSFSEGSETPLSTEYPPHVIKVSGRTPLSVALDPIYAHLYSFIQDEFMKCPFLAHLPGISAESLTIKEIDKLLMKYRDELIKDPYYAQLMSAQSDSASNQQHPQKIYGQQNMFTSSKLASASLTVRRFKSIVPKKTLSLLFLLKFAKITQKTLLRDGLSFCLRIAESGPFSPEKNKHSVKQQASESSSTSIFSPPSSSSPSSQASASTLFRSLFIDSRKKDLLLNDSEYFPMMQSVVALMKAAQRHEQRSVRIEDENASSHNEMKLSAQLFLRKWTVDASKVISNNPLASFDSPIISSSSSSASSTTSFSKITLSNVYSIIPFILFALHKLGDSYRGFCFSSASSHNQLSMTASSLPSAPPSAIIIVPNAFLANDISRIIESENQKQQKYLKPSIFFAQKTEIMPLPRTKVLSMEKMKRLLASSMDSQIFTVHCKLYMVAGEQEDFNNLYRVMSQKRNIYELWQATEKVYFVIGDCS
eukprot:MONOS_2372.1-p1 / transcript=MONOS_2372.1 / gene=MONOS_2372 / organism=Monocercomonoides_exilis_PA203 / gene_product=unspecified product / transcript_product=unspecified product / location=Mono_scaffold00048:156943-161336(+) / protein_length=1288 / sequence_SO=supercontig / SO=protein_coding / is_pseudo=false